MDYITRIRKEHASLRNRRVALRARIAELERMRVFGDRTDAEKNARGNQGRFARQR
jgi:hypothetical protein